PQRVLRAAADCRDHCVHRFSSGDRHAPFRQFSLIDLQSQSRRLRQVKETVDGPCGIFEYRMHTRRGVVELTRLVACSWLAARCNLAKWSIIGCVWCGTSPTPCALASATQRIRPVIPPILAMSGCTIRT